MPSVLALAATVLLSLWPAAAGAQETLQQTVVVTAAATPVTLGSVTRTVTVLTRETIAQLPVRSVADLLRLAASVDVRARGERGVQADFSVRGAGFGQALVLVDGVRLNDAQSGHHNGDIPVPLEAVERIEILHGVGASLFGADAFAGTINVITRRAAPASAAVEAGSFGLAGGRAQGSFQAGGVTQLLSGSFSRSDGFMYERQFAVADLLARTAVGDRSTLTVGYVRKDFGANGFYGPAPSHEWTSQLLVSGEHRVGRIGGWEVGMVVAYRTHRDRFLFNVERPGVSENVHRSHALLGTVKASRAFGASAVTVGAEAGGDWIRSTNLRDHDTGRASAFGEWRHRFSARLLAEGSVRVDRYDEFGTTGSPSAGIAWWPAPRVRVRASGGRAFRVPTFTERYYSDPANLAREDVGPETTWGGEGGADLFLSDAWMLQGTVFGRRDRDVIDWLRATTADRWRTYNVHRVRTEGMEVSARRMLSGGALLQAGYTWTRVNADTISTLCGAPGCLSKYVLEYAPHGLAVGGVVPIAGLRVAPRLEYRHRRRNAATTDYAVLDLRVSRAFGRYELQVEGTNLGDADYQEIAGVAMPGRAASVTFAIR